MLYQCLQHSTFSNQFKNIIPFIDSKSYFTLINCISTYEIIRVELIIEMFGTLQMCLNLQRRNNLLIEEST